MLLICLVSFNSITLFLVIAASDLSLRTIKFCSVVFRVMLALLVINTSSSISREQQTTPLLITRDECRQLGGRTVDNSRRKQIMFENRDFCLVHLHSTLSLRFPVRILP